MSFRDRELAYDLLQDRRQEEAEDEDQETDEREGV
jgi:hypothetical protein